MTEFAQATLRLLATTDIHMHLMAYDYDADQPKDNVGFARSATLIRQASEEARAKSIPVVLVDNGDAWQGNPLAETLQKTRHGHPLVSAMKVLGYDAAVLGNHDFDTGMAFVDMIVDEAEFPIFSSNAKRIPETAWPEFVLLHRKVRTSKDTVDDIRIGILGLTPPQTEKWNRQQIEGALRIEDYVAGAARVAAKMRAEGADIVVALAHTGIAAENSANALENAALELSGLPEIDVLIAGHTHLLLPGPHHAGIEFVDRKTGTLRGKPAMMSGAEGGHLGVMDLALENRNGSWSVCGHSVENRPISERLENGQLRALVRDDHEVAQIFRPAHLATLDRVRTPVGEIKQPLHTYFAAIAPCAALELIAQAQFAAAQKVMDRDIGSRLPLLSAVSPDKLGGRSGPEYYTHIPAGRVQLRHVSGLQVFPNNVAVAFTTGRAVTDWLEISAGLFSTLKAGNTSEMPLIHDETPGYNFDVIFGLEYEIDISVSARFGLEGQLRNPDAHRIQKLSYNGKPVDPEQMFAIATNNFRANGGGQFPGFGRDVEVHHTSLPIRDQIEKALDGRLATLQRFAQPWRFKPLDGAQALFQTSPLARGYETDIASFKPVDLGLNDLGFLQLRLSL